MFVAKRPEWPTRHDLEALLVGYDSFDADLQVVQNQKKSQEPVTDLPPLTAKEFERRYRAYKSWRISFVDLTIAISSQSWYCYQGSKGSPPKVFEFDLGEETAVQFGNASEVSNINDSHALLWYLLWQQNSSMFAALFKVIDYSWLGPEDEGVISRFSRDSEWLLMIMRSTANFCYTVGKSRAQGVQPSLLRIEQIGWLIDEFITQLIPFVEFFSRYAVTRPTMTFLKLREKLISDLTEAEKRLKVLSAFELPELPAYDTTIFAARHNNCKLTHIREKMNEFRSQRPEIDPSAIICGEGSLNLIKGREVAVEFEKFLRPEGKRPRTKKYR